MRVDELVSQGLDAMHGDDVQTLLHQFERSFELAKGQPGLRQVERARRRVERALRQLRALDQVVVEFDVHRGTAAQCRQHTYPYHAPLGGVRVVLSRDVECAHQGGPRRGEIVGLHVRHAERLVGDHHAEPVPGGGGRLDTVVAVAMACSSVPHRM